MQGNDDDFDDFPCNIVSVFDCNASAICKSDAKPPQQRTSPSSRSRTNILFTIPMLLTDTVHSDAGADLPFDLLSTMGFALLTWLLA